MLSILVPVYNFEVTDFVRELKTQAENAQIDFEILCYDDCSEERYKIKNRAIAQLDRVIYKELPANIGRSRIRNKLANDASFNHLLFVDCDSIIIDHQYIQRYLANISSTEIIYGGRTYPGHPPADISEHLWWQYGIEKESPSLKERKQNPYLFFKTNNFLAPRHIFENNNLNENLIGYGHEDTHFGLKLKEKGIPVNHIENPLCHIGSISNDEFMQKTKEGLSNMAYLIDKGQISEEIKLYRYYNLLKNLRLEKVFRVLFRQYKKLLLNNLKSRNPRLRFLDIYKLGMLIENTKESEASE